MISGSKAKRRKAFKPQAGRGTVNATSIILALKIYKKKSISIKFIAII